MPDVPPLDKTLVSKQIVLGKSLCFRSVRRSKKVEVKIAIRRAKAKNN